MYSYKLEKRFYFLLIIFMMVIPVCVLGIVTMISEDILYYDEVMSLEQKLSFIISISLVLIVWIIALIIYLIRMKKNHKFIIDQEGIKDYYIFTLILAFLYIGSVKTILYSSITSIEHEDNVFMLTLDKKTVECKWLTKLLLPSKIYIIARSDEELVHLKRLLIKDSFGTLE